MIQNEGFEDLGGNNEDILPNYLKILTENGWGTRSRTSIRGVRVAVRQEIKIDASRMKTLKRLRKSEIEADRRGTLKNLEREGARHRISHRLDWRLAERRRIRMGEGRTTSDCPFGTTT